LGDLKHGRTVHSLARLLSLYKVKINYVAPDILRMPPELIDELNAKGVEQMEYTTLEACLPETDVLYVTRVQKERFTDEAVYESVKGAYVIDPKVLKAAKERMIVMHPLPRVGEISMEVDDDPRAAYFRQMEYGLYVRMALLAMVLGKA
jgi:aspartate carbamoyltransferase catalytic subunit